MASPARSTLLQILLGQAWFAFFGFLFGSPPWDRFHYSLDVRSLALGLAAGLGSSLSLSLLPDSWLGSLGGRLTRIFQQYQWPILASLGPAGWVIVSVAAGISEELFFRGFIQEAVIQRTNLVMGILLASGIFGLFHWIHWSIVIFTGLLGLYFGLLYYFSDNIVVPIVAHTIHNVVSLFLAARQFGYPLKDLPAVETRLAEAVSSGGDENIPPVEEKGSDSS